MVWVQGQKLSVIASRSTWPFVARGFCLLDLPFQRLTHSLGLVLAVVQQHLGRKALDVEDLDVHSSEED